MIRIHLVAADGGQTTLEVKPKGSLMEAAVKNDVDGIDGRLLPIAKHARMRRGHGLQGGNRMFGA